MNADQIRILFLAASPKTLAKLDLDGEYEAIEERLNDTPHASSFLLQHRWKIGRDQILDLLLKYQPHVVHFSGHGIEDNLLLQDHDGNPWALDRQMARETFKAARETLKLVVFNACYSRDVAEDVSEVIDCVMGMSLPVRDSTAIKFASTLYSGIGAGLNLREAFNQARTQISNSGLSGPRIPQILTRPGLDPRQLRPLNWINTQMTPPRQGPDQAPRPINLINDRPGLRIALDKHLPTDGDFDRFVLLYCRDVYRRFSRGMDRVEKTTLLLAIEEPTEVASALERYVNDKA